MDIVGKNQKENEKRVAEEYFSSLSDLNCNSKPLINMLTMLAEENIEFAPVIVKVVADHITKVPPDIKLPILYLIDSIVKNVKNTYIQLFSQYIVNIFCDVFEKVAEKVRERMYALRQTWNEVFSSHKLYTLDVRVKRIDNNWPITAKQPQPSIHVNPNFLKTATQAIPTDMEEILHVKTRELLELKKRKLELELEATKKHLEEQEKQLSKTTESVIPPIDALVASNTSLQPVIRTPGGPPTTRIISGFVPPSLMGAQHQIHGAPAVGPPVGMRPGMYHHNFRNPRSVQMAHMIAPRMMNMQTQGFPSGNNMGKPKVNPVDPALLNTVRHRDPRLARQMQQQQQLQQQQQQNMQSGRGNSSGGGVVSGGSGGGGGSKSTELARTVSKSPEKNGNKKGSSSTSTTYRSASASGGDSSNKSSHSSSNFVADSKSPPIRHAASSNRSSGRSSKTDSRRADKQRERKRSESKSSTTSSSSAGSNSSSRNRKGSYSALSGVEKCDKDAFEIQPLSDFKRKSSSPTNSPSKLSRDSLQKRTKESSKSAHNNQQRSRLRNPSPDLSALKDVDLRKLSTGSVSAVTNSFNNSSPEKRLKLLDSEREDTVTSTAAAAAAAATANSTPKDLDKNIKITLEPSKDVDLRQLTSSTLESMSIQVAAPLLTRSDNASIVATSSPKVSFKIQKLFNKLEKSTRNLSTVLNSNSSNSSQAATNTASLAKQKAGGDDMESGSGVGTAATGINGRQGMLPPLELVTLDGEEDDGKKRPSTEDDTSEPLPKKSKSSKLDALFGTEDVDLRIVVPPHIRVSQKTLAEDILTPPPPPMISDEETPMETSQENAFNKKVNKTKNAGFGKSGNQRKLSLLDDVRAKLAKAAKYNKIKKAEKTSDNQSQRFKIQEQLGTNEDTQEANDEKIRTIITQAQELLEINSISQEQYKNLIQTVMSINENNKLEEAKRRESASKLTFNFKNEQRGEQEEEVEMDADSHNEEAGRREAVLKKRIPKLPKGSRRDLATSDNSSPSGVGNEGGGDSFSFNVDKEDSNDDGKFSATAFKEKRVKHSKWGDRGEFGNVNITADVPNPKQHSLTPRPWVIGPFNKHRGGGAFRGSLQPPPMRMLPQMPWQVGGAGSGPTSGPVGPSFAPSLQRCNTPPTAPLPPNGPSPAPPKPCNSIDNPQADLVRSITIDGTAKEIRIYDQVAIVFMEADQPREIGFQAGQRSIIIDNQEPITLHFNDEYRHFTIAGEAHRLRFGFPSRELYIDENWYEIYFGGPPVSIPIRNQLHILKAEGPPPQVNIGPLRRDLVVGKINMIVDALIVVPLFLDARVQTFQLKEQEHSVQFADQLLTVLLDEEPLKVEYGGLPKSITIGNEKHFVRFGALPQGVVAGRVCIANMIHVKTQPPVASLEKADAQKQDTSDLENKNEVQGDEIKTEESHVVASNIEEPAPANTNSNSKLPTSVLNNINIDELFQKLVSQGIILPGAAAAKKQANETSDITSTAPTATVTAVISEEPSQTPVITPIDLSKSETVKTRQSAVVTTLFSGMQCSSCGVRFPPEQTIKYSQHLDWHFRQNRRERDSTRKAHSRRWYYDLSDWVQYEEIEDLEEREKNFFESQQNELLEVNDEVSNQRSMHSPAPSCPAGPDDVDRVCDMCQEKFEQFYNEDLEEWHLRLAIRIEDKIYHPICYEDYKASLNSPEPTKEELNKNENQELLNVSDDNAMDTVIKVEDSKIDEDITFDDDGEDDDVIVLPNEEPTVTEIVDDDEEYEPINVTREEMGHVNADGSEDSILDATESDVEIQEPHIPFTDLDTYVEKPLPETDDASRLSFANIKIKEEPKDEDEDEDDDFEDVGTVLLVPEEEISVQSSNDDTRIQAIDSSLSAVSPSTADMKSAPADATAIPNEAMDSNETPMAVTEGDLETEGEHNLSTVGPVPAIPLASLVNKIKINITKNVTTAIVTTNTTSSSETITTNSSSSVLPPPTVSTIPVLCGGTASSAYSSISTITSSNSDKMSIDATGSAVSTISVIGASYGSSALSPSRYQPQAMAAVKPTRQTTPPPVPIEDTITYDQKPTLRQTKLQKVKKVECGMETSGLCSIM